LLSYTADTGDAAADTRSQASMPPPYEANSSSDDYAPSSDGAFAEFWHNFETRVIAFADERGVTLSQLHVRFGTVVTGVLVFYILVQIF